VSGDEGVDGDEDVSGDEGVDGDEDVLQISCFTIYKRVESTQQGTKDACTTQAKTREKKDSTKKKKKRVKG
jgi:hypothetical protein